MRARRTIVLAAVLTAMPSPVDAEPFQPNTGDIVHLQSATTGRTDGGTDLRLPPGYFLDEPTFRAKDAEMRRLQELETRLKAENESFRKTAKDWQPGWKTLATTFVLGVAGGVYIYSKLN